MYPCEFVARMKSRADHHRRRSVQISCVHDDLTQRSNRALGIFRRCGCTDAFEACPGEDAPSISTQRLCRPSFQSHECKRSIGGKSVQSIQERKVYAPALDQLRNVIDRHNGYVRVTTTGDHKKIATETAVRNRRGAKDTPSS